MVRPADGSLGGNLESEPVGPRGEILAAQRGGEGASGPGGRGAVHRLGPIANRGSRPTSWLRRGSYAQSVRYVRFTASRDRAR